MATQRIQLFPRKVYHFYNHANGNDNLFRNKGNYHYFMKKYAEYLSSVFDTFAYCLLPNHFHFLIRVKDEKTIAELLNPKGFEKPLGFMLAHRVGSFQNAYAKAFNKQQNRKGSLFMQSFGRRLVEDERYYLRLIHYIHANPVHHRLTNKMSDWKYSSYHTYLTAKETRMNREEVLSWFGGSDNFLKFHEKGIDTNLILEMEEKP
jgi:REP element-mobilizing transposase RayT